VLVNLVRSSESSVFFLVVWNRGARDTMPVPQDSDPEGET